MRALLGSIVVLLLLGSQALAQEPPKKDLPKPLSDDVVKAWTKAGAELVWVKNEMIFELGGLEKGDGDGLLSEKPQVGSIPTFIFDEWNEGAIAKLPPPNNPFGIIFSKLGDKKVTDAELKEMANLKNLTHLLFHPSELTDKGYIELANLKSLTSLSLFDGKITDAGLKELANLKNLTSLNLYGSDKITDAGLKELANLKNITSLSLSFTKVTDAGLKELANLKNLTTLKLGGRGITDEGLKELSNLKNLTYLLLHCPATTAAGVAGLQKALPKCKIERQ